MSEKIIELRHIQHTHAGSATKQNFGSMKNDLHHEKYLTDFAHVTTIFLVFLMTKQSLKSKNLMVRSFTICFFNNYYYNSVTPQNA